MTEMTPERLREIEARLEAATYTWHDAHALLAEVHRLRGEEVAPVAVETVQTCGNCGHGEPYKVECDVDECICLAKEGCIYEHSQWTPKEGAKS